MAHQDFKNHLALSTLTEREQIHLIRLIEECGEVTQAVTKLMRFGWLSTSPFDPKQETNIDALKREVNDLLNVVEDAGLLPAGYRRIVGALDETL